MSLTYRGGGSRTDQRHVAGGPEKQTFLVTESSGTATFIAVLLLILFAVALGWLFWALFHPHSESPATTLLNETSVVQSLVDAFARTITQQDWRGNAALFVSGGTSLANFRRAMTFLPMGDLVVDSTPIVSPVGSWRHHLEVYSGGFSSNHMSLTNCNMSFWRSTLIVAAPLQSSITCIATYAYTLSYNISQNTSAYPTLLTHFQVHFDAVQNAIVAAPHFAGWQFTYALALPNATTTLLSSVDTGVAPPGAITTKRRTGHFEKVIRDLSDPNVVWTTLQDQIQALVASDQFQVALAVCKTMQYQDLSAIFDPDHNDTSLLCNTLQPAPFYLDGPLVCTNSNFALDPSCLPDRIRTINGILPEASVPVQPNSLDFTITGGVGIAISGGMHGITINNMGLLLINLTAPFPFYFTKTLSLTNPSIEMYFNDTQANTVWAGPTSGPNGQPAFRLLVLDDIPLINLSTHVTSVLNLSHGGTNNAGPYNGNRIIVSNANGTQLKEASVLANGFFLVGDGAGNLVPGTLAPGAGINITFNSGIFTITDIEAISVVQVDLSVPTNIFQVTSMPVTTNGTLSFAVIPQSAHTFWAGPVSGSSANPSFRTMLLSDIPLIDLSSHVTNTLGVSNGGTNNNGSSWVGERVLMTDTGGTSITEGTVTGTGGISVTLGPGPSLVISGTGGTCVNSTIDPSCLDISHLSCPNGPLNHNCVDQSLSLNSLSVSGSTSLGSSTICDAPLHATCYDISQQACPGGHLNPNCFPDNIILNTLTANAIITYNLTLINATAVAVEQGNFNSINASLVSTDYLNLLGPMVCQAPNGKIDQECYDISSMMCHTPVDDSCIPHTPLFDNVTVANTLTIDLLVCPSHTIPDTCTPIRVKTINGVLPTASPGLDFTLSAGTGISISPVTHGLNISNTGVTSVGLSLPSSILSVTVSPVTTTGVLTAVLQTQAAHSFWAGPLFGSPDTPTFRLIDFSDLPTNSSTNSVYFIDGAGNLDAAPFSISLSVPSAEFALSGSPMTNPSGGFTITKQNQNANSFWAGPLLGGPADPSFRSLSLLDFAPLGLTNGQILTGVTSGAPVGKTLVAGTNMVITEMAGSFVFDASDVDSIMNISMTVPAWLSVTPTTLYSSGSFDITANTQAAHTFLAGPTSGGAAVPSFRSIGYSDLPVLSDGQIYIGFTGGAPVPTQLTAGALISVVPGPGTSTISTSALGMVTLNMPVSLYTVSSSSGANTQTLTVSLISQTANTVWAGPSTGIPATPTFRLLSSLDIPSLDTSKLTSGILPISRGGTNSGTALLNGKIMVSSGGAIVEGTSSSTPSFVSETLTATTNQLTLGTTNTATISATAPAASRTYTISDPGANANFVMDSGGALTITNVGTTGQILRLTSGTTATWQTVTGTGSVTSVGLSLPASVFSISGSPVTTTGTLTGSFNTQTANTVFAGPTSGGAAVPTFRPLVTADLPVAILLSYLEATYTTPAEIGLAPAVYTVITSMTLTPAAGTHWCSFSATFFPSSGSVMFDIAIHVNGVIVQHSRRVIGGSGSNFIVHTLAVVTTPGGQAVDVRFIRTSVSGTTNIYERSLYCLRIG